MGNDGPLPVRSDCIFGNDGLPRASHCRTARSSLLCLCEAAACHSALARNLGRSTWPARAPSMRARFLHSRKLFGRASIGRSVCTRCTASDNKHSQTQWRASSPTLATSRRCSGQMHKHTKGHNSSTWTQCQSAPPPPPPHHHHPMSPKNSRTRPSCTQRPLAVGGRRF